MKKNIIFTMMIAVLIAGNCGRCKDAAPEIVVLISADTEWKEVLAYFNRPVLKESPYGAWFIHRYERPGGAGPVMFFHGGWGKIAAAGSTQYAIDTWKPKLLINLGTCGGFEGAVKKGDIILVNGTVVYDIVEQMGDSHEAIGHYSVKIDSGIFPRKLLKHVRPYRLVSADRDIIAGEIPALKRTYNAIAADWESGAIAFVSNKNNTKLIILRGVSDLVGAKGGEAYNNMAGFTSGAGMVMKKLLGLLPEIITSVSL